MKLFNHTIKNKTYFILSFIICGLILIKPSVYAYHHTNHLIEFLTYFLLTLLSLIALMMYAYRNHYSGNKLKRNFLNIFIYLTILIMATIGTTYQEVPTLLAMFVIFLFCLPIICIVAIICYFITNLK